MKTIAKSIIFCVLLTLLSGCITHIRSPKHPDAKSIAGYYYLPENSLAICYDDSLRLYDREISLHFSSKKVNEDEYRIIGFDLFSNAFGAYSWKYDRVSNTIILNEDDNEFIELNLRPKVDSCVILLHACDSIKQTMPQDTIVLDSLRSMYNDVWRRLIGYIISPKNFWGPVRLEVINSTTLKLSEPICLRVLTPYDILDVVNAKPDEELYFRRYHPKEPKKWKRKLRRLYNKIVDFWKDTKL